MTIKYKKMKKILNIGTVPTGKTRSNIYCKIEIRQLGDNPSAELSISGVIGPLPSGNARGGCGQIDMEFAHKDPTDNDKRYSELIKPEQIKFAQGWTAALWLNFLDVWKKYHLNDTHAGCEHQRNLGWEREGYDKHPSEPCPTCGYKFGTAWKSEQVPQSVIKFLNALPESTKTPAWV